MNNLKAGNDITVWANQADREAVILAVIGEQALIEYVMPKLTTALRLVPVDDVNTYDYKTYAYNKIPVKWMKAIREQGTEDMMRIVPQTGMGTRYQYQGYRNSCINVNDTTFQDLWDAKFN